MGQLRGAVKEAPCRPTQTDERTDERTDGRTDPVQVARIFLVSEMVEVTEEQPDGYGWTSKEWFWLILDSSCLSMIIVAATGGDCSGIPSLKPMVFAFGTVTLLLAVAKFVFKLRRSDVQQRVPRIAHAVKMCGLVQLGLGIWGIAITIPKALGGSDLNCTTPVFMVGFIPSVIIAGVLVGLVCMLFAWAVRRPNQDGRMKEEWRGLPIHGDDGGVNLLAAD